MGEKGEEECNGSKKHKWVGTNRQGEVKNSVGNGEAKELLCMTHGQELSWGNAGGRGCRAEGNKREKKWDNCNSIIIK